MSVKKKLSLNLSNQANFSGVFKTDLFQVNYVFVIGLDYLNKNIHHDKKKIPLTFKFNKNNELEIEGINGTINDDSIKIYTDRKVTESQD
ncbi:hypothetical protein [Halothermothrix orenii]|uniref:hypothetical protein n=1 Tax=Halothermothrix orenii TaxID=31909 RepID=UPI0002EA308E|nr:hypothetical protein [Halothermothrix orenii]